VDGWWHEVADEVAAAFGVLIGVLVGRRAVRTDADLADDRPCEKCGKTKAGCPPHLPPAQFWLTVAGGVTAILVTWTTLQVEVRELKEWRDRAEIEHFTHAEAKQTRLLLDKEIEAERTFARSLCNDLKRIQIELGKVPSSDCTRP
jgi:predicted metal-binding protein